MIYIIRPSFAVLALALTLLTGCAAFGPRYHVDITALSDAQATQKRMYLIIPGQGDVDSNNLQFKEFARYLDRALQARGFLPAQKQGAAEIVILLKYGISDPHTTYHSYPVFGNIGGGTSTFSGSTFGSHGYSHTTGSVSSEPRFGVIGTGTSAQTRYIRWASMEAVDIDEFAKTQKMVRLWQTIAMSSGSSGDLRLVFPILIAAAQPYIATQTSQQVQRTLKDSSPEVISVRGGTP